MGFFSFLNSKKSSQGSAEKLSMLSQTVLDMLKSDVQVFTESQYQELVQQFQSLEADLSKASLTTNSVKELDARFNSELSKQFETLVREIEFIKKENPNLKLDGTYYQKCQTLKKNISEQFKKLDLRLQASGNKNSESGSPSCR